jgi:hypothetical protein
LTLKIKALQSLEMLVTTISAFQYNIPWGSDLRFSMVTTQPNGGLENDNESLGFTRAGNCMYREPAPSINHSIGMCRMRRFLAVLRSFFYSCLLYNFPATLLHQVFFHPSLLTLAIYFLVYLSVLLFPNSYIILFCELYFIPFSVRAQTNVIYVTLLSLL